MAEELPKDFSLSPPATEDIVAAAEYDLGTQLPADYRAFVLTHDGGEGFVGEHYLVLWKAAELSPFNKDYEVQDYAPGFLVFGSNGGGEGFAFDTRTSPCAVVMVPFIGMSHRDGIRVADSFSDLIRRMRENSESLLGSPRP